MKFGGHEGALYHVIARVDEKIKYKESHRKILETKHLMRHLLNKIVGAVYSYYSIEPKEIREIQRAFLPLKIAISDGGSNLKS